MFGFVIGGSGRLYLAVPIRFGDEWGTAWRPIQSRGEYRMFGRCGGCFQILLNNPTLPHPLTGRPSDPPVRGVQGKRGRLIFDDFAALEAAQS